MRNEHTKTEYSRFQQFHYLQMHNSSKLRRKLNIEFTGRSRSLRVLMRYTYTSVRFIHTEFEIVFHENIYFL